MYGEGVALQERFSLTECPCYLTRASQDDR